MGHDGMDNWIIFSGFIGIVLVGIIGFLLGAKMTSFSELCWKPARFQSWSFANLTGRIFPKLGGTPTTAQTQVASIFLQGLKFQKKKGPWLLPKFLRTKGWPACDQTTAGHFLCKMPLEVSRLIIQEICLARG